MRPERGREVRDPPPPGRLLSPMGLSGAATWPRPQRSTAARVAIGSAVDTACAVGQLL